MERFGERQREEEERKGDGEKRERVCDLTRYGWQERCACTVGRVHSVSSGNLSDSPCNIPETRSGLIYYYEFKLHSPFIGWSCCLLGVQTPPLLDGQIRAYR